MRYLRLIPPVLLGLVLFLLAFANREMVEVRVLPQLLADLVGSAGPMRLPLFLVIFLSLLAGTLIGLLWEWARQRRRARVQARREAESQAAARPDPQKDEVLRLLERSESTGSA